jgi:hypothetical protein
MDADMTQEAMIDVVFVGLGRTGSPARIRWRDPAGAGLDPIVHRRRLWCHALLVQVAATYLGTTPEDIGVATDDQGKPRLTPPYHELRFSLARSGDLAAFALTRDAEVGIDLERVDSGLDAVKLARLLPAERSRSIDEASPTLRTRVFFEQWTAHEAQLKATGRGFAASVALPCATVGIAAPDGYVAAVAARASHLRVRP